MATGGAKGVAIKGKLKSDAGGEVRIDAAVLVEAQVQPDHILVRRVQPQPHTEAPVDFKKGPLAGRGHRLKYWVESNRLRLEGGQQHPQRKLALQHLS